jgi:hypothetical protein
LSVTTGDHSATAPTARASSAGITTHGPIASGNREPRAAS